MEDAKGRKEGHTAGQRENGGSRARRENEKGEKSRSFMPLTQ